jgi:hypothetical protein
MTLDITHLKPGDKVRLRNGDIKEVTENDSSDLPLCLQGGDWYYPGGNYYDNNKENELDIIEILPTPTPKRNLRDLWVKTETAYGSNLINPIPPISYIHHPTKRLNGIRYQGQLFTPADAWPEPIKDRAPTKEDADPNGEVQCFSEYGDWLRYSWNSARAQDAGYGWSHTRDWKPKPTPVYTREEVIDMVRDEAIFHNSDVGPDLIDSILAHLGANQ